ncbi:MAG: GNAT family N-acetyltransferase [Chthoniobacterales bacterium]|nr:MAG: GNAT family N-acetyltransferase [Chthoniobacterales bacterium]
MANAILTREFRIDDFDAALRLWREAEGVEIAEGDSKDEIAHFLERNPGLSRVAVADGVIAGVILCGHDGRRGHIYHLVVSPAHQRRGIARRLVQECLEGLRKAGILRATILVASDNDCGRSFWLRNGWEHLDDAMAMGINP